MSRKTIAYLEDLYRKKGVECAWLSDHGTVFSYANKNGLAVCGSIGLAIGHKNPTKEPSDIDLACTSNTQALAFIRDTMEIATRYSFHARLYIQSKTDWVPEGAIAHYRISSTMWKDICIFVVNELRVWYPCGGLRVQKYDDIIKKAKELTERDNKPRVQHIPLELDVDFNETPPPEENECEDQDTRCPIPVTRKSIFDFEDKTDNQHKGSMK